MPRRMTPLEQLIHEQVRASTVATMSRKVDHLADSLAEEILQDPQWRAEMRALVQKAFSRTIAELTNGKRQKGRR